MKYKISIELSPERGHDFSISESGTLTLSIDEDCEYSQKIAAVIVRMLREYNHEPSAYEWVLASMAGCAGDPLHEVALLYKCWDGNADIEDCISVSFEREKLIQNWDLEDSWCQKQEKTFAGIDERKRSREFYREIVEKNRQRKAARELAASTASETECEGARNESA